ncbi:MAG: YeeE/YedE family protein [Spirochaetes bacterium]|nr:YeeE/YedE family protein [Spirochaetota bacterium]
MMSALLFLLSLAVGFLAQRSRMCFVAGIRDYFLVRDTELLLGLVSFLVTVFFLTSLFYSLNVLKSGFPQFGEIDIDTVIKRSNFSFYRLRYLDGFFETTQGNGRFQGVFTTPFFYVTLSGALLMGTVSVLAGGCAMRQHVMFAQGRMDSFYYLLGFYCAVYFYYLVLYKPLLRFY